MNQRDSTPDRRPVRRPVDSPDEGLVGRSPTNRADIEARHGRLDAIQQALEQVAADRTRAPPESTRERR